MSDNGAPKCFHQKVLCIDSRPRDGYRHRSYRCQKCGHTYTTIEVPFKYQAGAFADGTRALIRLARLGKRELGDLMKALDIIKDNLDRNGL